MIPEQKDKLLILCEMAASINADTNKGKSLLSDKDLFFSTIAALNQFSECIRYLNTRRSKGAVLNVESEADLQDVIFLMLRPWFHDIVPENPTSKSENRFVIKDFLLPSAKTIVEAKFVRDKNHGKNISQEIHDDIEMYRKHPLCERIIFFIYDPEMQIPSQRSLVEPLEVERVYGGKYLDCKVIIKP